MCQAFGVGEFSQVVSVLCSGETRVADLLRTWRLELSHDDSSDGPWAPYRIHQPGTTGGLIPWGISRTAEHFYWQVTDGPVDAWPVLAMQVDYEDGWHRYEMTATEFLYRILTDPEFQPYSVAQFPAGLSFEPG
ncbi:hypothetical protein GCM10010121_061760 [Streptomyces brasiliensis]|uniref:Uncharacterized protein n=1 Tax=Streptomyces brasiliensis TaxID=1954 RepID=A0A917L3A9_9ACTN|nr:hypothetical protein GCM10010121_061760 [Streptomyces brasiliensis]